VCLLHFFYSDGYEIHMMLIPSHVEVRGNEWAAQLAGDAIWFRRYYGDQIIFSMINRMMANHSCLRSHLVWIGIVKIPMCACSRDYETVDYVLWGCERFDAKRPQRLTDTE
jgi:hypothetical protein